MGIITDRRFVLHSPKTVGRQSGGCFSPPVKDTSKRKFCSAKRSSRDAKVFGRSARGLMWLTLAREGAIDSKKDNWIIDLYDEAVASANDDDRQNALAYLEDHLKRRN
jgi:hypothetical protein